MKKPLILVTNDDGISAPGIAALVNAVKPLGDLLIVAPDKPQSGMGHAITVNNVLRLNKSREFKGLNAYECSGTPVDCVKLAISHLLKKKPDLIVSGVNHGANYSTNVLYSGTMSAAVEGAMEGIPSVGFSLLDHGHDADFSASEEVARFVSKEILKKGLVVILNILNTEIKVNDTIIIEKDGKYSKTKIVSLQVDNKNVSKVANGEVGIKLDLKVFPKSTLWIQ